MAAEIDVKKNAQAILHVCSYHRNDFDFVTIRTRPHEMQPVAGSLQNPFTTDPIADLGYLECLPRELLVLFLEQFDLVSYFRFRQLNRRARIISTESRKYKLVANHGLEGLRAQLRSGLGLFFTIGELYRPLITRDYELCGNFGGFVWLFDCKRCCIECIRYSPRLAVWTLEEDEVQCRELSLEDLGSSIIRTVPSLYSFSAKFPAKVPRYLALKTALPPPMEEPSIPMNASCDDLSRYELRKAIFDRHPPMINSPNRWEHADTEIAGISLRCPHLPHTPYTAKGYGNERFMACATFPWCDVGKESTVKIEYGINCRGCQYQLGLTVPDKYRQTWRTRLEMRDKVYSSAGFLEHFESCTHAKDIWVLSKGGTGLYMPPQFTHHTRGGHLLKLAADGLPR